MELKGGCAGAGRAGVGLTRIIFLLREAGNRVCSNNNTISYSTRYVKTTNNEQANEPRQFTFLPLFL